MKINDVYTFRYNEEMAKKMFNPYHCFDGTLVVKENRDGRLFLQDTYWGGSTSRTLTIEEAKTQGHLTFICNLDEVTLVTEEAQRYYDDKDIFYIHIHAGYRSQWYKRRGAERSKAKMIQSIQEKIGEAERAKQSAEWAIERHQRDLEMVQEGNLSVYI